MQFSTAFALLAAAVVSVSAGHGYDNVTYTTQVVTSYVTYCPSATMLTYGTNTYTITGPTTLTISDCPCTVSMPVYTSSVTSCSTCAPATPIKPIPTSSSSQIVVVQPSVKTASPVASTAYKPSSVVNGTSPPIATFTGGAAANSKMNVVGGIAGMGVIGLVALML